jgi:inner membrane protein
MDAVSSNAFHRTITHSLLFFILISPILGLLIQKIHPKSEAQWRDWTLLAFLALFTHALLDCFTTWGTELFWPISYQIAWQSIFVIDPFYTIPLLVFLILALRKPRQAKVRQILNYIGLGISSGYLLMSLVIKSQVNEVVQNSLNDQNISHERLETRPAPLNTILWAANAESENGYYIGYYSLLDEGTQINFHYYPKNREFLKHIPESESLSKLKRMSEGWYTLNQKNDSTYIFNDLRFGTSKAWEPGGKFIFSYEIQVTSDKQVAIVQNERSFEEEPGTILRNLLERIQGNKSESP